MTRRTLVALLSVLVGPVTAQDLLEIHGETIAHSWALNPAFPLTSFGVYSVDAFPSHARIDQNGTVVFPAKLNVSGGIQPSGQFVLMRGRSTQDLELLIQSGEQAAGLPANTEYSGEQRVIISPYNEHLLFSTGLFDPVNPANTPANSDTALYHLSSGAPVLVAREGEQVPGLAPGVTWDGIDMESAGDLSIDSDGHIVMQARLGGTVPPGADKIIVHGTASQLQTVIREGDAMPDGAIVTESFDRVSPFVQRNAQGQVFLELQFSTLFGTATPSTDQALALWDQVNGLSIIARKGDQVPGLPQGTMLGDIRTEVGPRLSNSGTVIFVADLVGAAVTAGIDDSAVLTADANGISVIQRRGDPGPIAGTEWEAFFDVRINSRGLVVMEARMRGPIQLLDDDILCVGTTGNWTVLLTEDQALPGFPVPTTGPYEIAYWGIGGHAITDNDLVLFSAIGISGSQVRLGLYAFDFEQGIRLAADGMQPIATGYDLEFLNWNSSTSNGLGMPTWCNQAGDFVVRGGLNNNLGRALLRGHVGSLYAKPASISATNGGTQTFSIECGGEQAGEFYALLGSESGTSPPLRLPLGPHLLPLVFDAWTSLSLGLANSPVYTNTIGILDANGAASASFNLPPSAVIPRDLHHAVITLDMNLMSTSVTEPAALRIY